MYLLLETSQGLTQNACRCIYVHYVYMYMLTADGHKSGPHKQCMGPGTISFSKWFPPPLQREKHFCYLGRIRVPAETRPHPKSAESLPHLKSDLAAFEIRPNAGHMRDPAEMRPHPKPCRNLAVSKICNTPEIPPLSSTSYTYTYNKLYSNTYTVYVQIDPIL